MLKLTGGMAMMLKFEQEPVTFACFICEMASIIRFEDALILLMMFC